MKKLMIALVCGASMVCDVSAVEGEPVVPVGVFTVTNSTPIVFTGHAPTGTINIASGVTAHVTFEDLSITNSPSSSLSIPPDSTLMLTLKGESHFSGADDASAGLHVPRGATLIITEDSTGTLYAHGRRGAGIGGSEGGDCGWVEIRGGKVIASSGGAGYEYGGAGIGGGRSENSGTSMNPNWHGGNGGTVIITGGEVVATGSSTAAGIGSGGPNNARDGVSVSGGVCEISGGKVTATGGSFGAGIGGSYYGHGGTIVISGGEVNATGGGQGAGIGGGYNGNSGSISITGGKVTTTNGTVEGEKDHNAAAIGGGYCVLDDYGCEKIIITNAHVVATSTGFGAGIGGGGHDGLGGRIEIYDSIVEASSTGNGCGIGGVDAQILIDGGMIQATGGRGSPGIGSFNNSSSLTGGSIVVKSGDVVAIGGHKGAGIGGGNLKSGCDVIIHGGDITATGGEFGAGIGALGNSVREHGGALTVYGGSVQAIGGENGYGIGCAYNTGSSTNISMSVIVHDGVVVAEGNGRAGIGSGPKPVKIVIRGGTVTAKGGDGCHGMSTTDSEIAPIEITGGSVKPVGGGSREVPAVYGKVINGVVHGSLDLYCVRFPKMEGATNLTIEVTTQDFDYEYVYNGHGHEADSYLYFHLPNGVHSTIVDGVKYWAVVDSAETEFKKLPSGGGSVGGGGAGVGGGGGGGGGAVALPSDVLPCLDRVAYVFETYMGFELVDEYEIRNLQDGKVSLKKVGKGKLPSGVKLKYDKKTGKVVLSGAPTKAGSFEYVCRIDEKVGREAREGVETTFRFVVKDMGKLSFGDPNYNPAAGKKIKTDIPVFTMDRTLAGLLNVSITAKNKITAKIKGVSRKTLSFRGNWQNVENGELSAVLKTKAGEVLVLILKRDGNICAHLSGVTGSYGSELASTEWGVAAIATDFSSYVGERVVTTDDGQEIVLTFKKKGKVSYKSTTNKSIKGTAQLLLNAYEDGSAQVCLVKQSKTLSYVYILKFD